jgi:hypothetical protein
MAPIIQSHSQELTMDTRQPGPEHAALDRLVGTWVGDEHMHPSQWCPQPRVVKGTSVSKKALNGFAVITDYTQMDGDVVTFTGHGVYTWSNEEQCMVLTWFDCMGSKPEVFKGNFDGNVLVMAHGGPGPHVRMRYEYISADQMHGSMEMSLDGEKWDKMFDGKYQKS